MLGEIQLSTLFTKTIENNENICTYQKSRKNEKFEH